MNLILENILFWLFIVLCIAVVCWVIFSILFWLAHQSATNAMAEKESELAKQQKELEEKEQHFKTDADAAVEKMTLIKNEAIAKEEKATEILSNAQQLKEESQIKVAQIMRENTKLRNELTAARQRAQRFAKRLEVQDN